MEVMEQTQMDPNISLNWLNTVVFIDEQFNANNAQTVFP